ncbi:MAG: 50S ribosomal protein L34e|nr:50S ribosomal protein L34e [Candidatus Lokiarchaeota archaeon]MBD3202050.1 50S ribosomal protein L34e [Candidatus Lokiarchaeota archaeon]
MPRPGYRSKKMKRIKKKTPGNKNTTHYWRKKPKRAHCAICKKPLQSIPRLRPTDMKNTQKTSRRATRLESGRYCASCLQMLIKESIYNS